MSQGAASRNFRLGLGVRTFQAGRRLPFNLASVFVQVKLPAGLVGRIACAWRIHFLAPQVPGLHFTISPFADIITDAGVTIPKDSNPFCSQPAVDVTRGSEVTLPAGQISLEFSTGLMRLAAMLAHEPRLTAEVWHKVKYVSCIQPYTTSPKPNTTLTSRLCTLSQLIRNSCLSGCVWRHNDV